MTVADDVLALLSGQPAGMSDAEIAHRLGRAHAHINQECRRLAAQGLVIRDRGAGTIVNRLATGAATVKIAPVPDRAVSRNADGMSPALRDRQVRNPQRHPELRDPGWEGDVQAAVVRYLSATGWAILRVADTATRERGVDVIAERDGRRLLVEVKGWPTTTYARGDRVGQPKPTPPSAQAGVWFAQGLLKLIRCHGVEPDAGLALALPDRPRYRTLLDDSRWAFERLGITVLLVDSNGTVTTWN